MMPTDSSMGITLSSNKFEGQTAPISDGVLPRFFPMIFMLNS
jgi:hypothetical protein